MSSEATITVITGDFVNLVITSSGRQYACTLERRFPKNLTIAELKGKMELQTGGNAATMSLELYDAEDKLVAKLDDDSKFLGFYPAENGMRLHVIDKTKCDFDDPSKVEKFELSAEEYEKRQDTLKAYLQKNRLGKYNEEEAEAKAAQLAAEESAQEAAAEKITVGSRCEVKVPGQPSRRGQIKHVGPVHFSKGVWVGVQYDEPLGKNNGTVEGKKYFECPPKYGGFVRPLSVTVGEFPVEGIGSDDEI